MRVRSVFSSFREYQVWWHNHCVDPDSELYSCGQFDEFPFVDWDENIEWDGVTQTYSRAGRGLPLIAK